MKPKITIQELAKKGKLSVATISRALNLETRNKVAPETCRIVDALAQKYNYVPNQAAKHLRQTSYRTLGIVFPHHEGIFLSEYYSQILSGVSDYLLDSDYAVKMILLKPEKPKWDHYDFKDGEAVDGLILTYWRTFFSDASVLANLNLPCAVVSNAEANVKAHFSGGDHFQGGRIAAEYLHSHGHRKIAVFTGPEGAPDAVQRLEGFKACLSENGSPLPEKSIFDVQFKEEEVYRFTQTLLQKRPDITAIFCMNDTMAFGVLRRLKELKIPCPQKISVMGYDNDRRAETAGLTTIQAPVYESAKRAAQYLIRFLKSGDSKEFYTPEFLPVSLVVRQSVGNVK